MDKSASLDKSKYEDLYVVVPWPESQEYMEEPWFEDESVLINDHSGIIKYGGSAYMIPVSRLTYTLRMILLEAFDAGQKYAIGDGPSFNKWFPEQM